MSTDTVTASDIVEGKRPRLRDVISGNGLSTGPTLGAQQTVGAAGKLLAAADHSAVIVQTADGDIAGIVTPRDIVCHLTHAGPSGLDDPIEQVMSQSVATKPDSANCNDTLGVMFENRYRNIPVIDEAGTLVGCVETLDVAKAKLAELTESNRKLMELLIRSTNERASVSPDTDVAQIAQRLRSENVNCVIVTDGDKCIGYITPDEVLRAQHKAQTATRHD